MNPFVDTLYFTLRRSILLNSVSLVAHGVVLLVAAILVWHTFWALPVMLAVVGSAVLSVRVGSANWIPATGRLRWSGDDCIHWADAHGQPQSAECLDAQLIGTWLIRLSLRAGRSRWRRRTLLIASDAVDASTHRRLRARVQVRGRGHRLVADD